MKEFTELKWSRPVESFGARGNVYCYVNGGDVIHCRTGNKPEDDVRLGLNAAGTYAWLFGGKFTGVFSEDPEAEEGLDFSSLYLSADGVDPKEGEDAAAFGSLYAGGVRPARENAALKPNTDYYFRVVGDGQARLTYASLSSDDVADLAVAAAVIEEVGDSIPMIHPFTGQKGIWFPE